MADPVTSPTVAASSSRAPAAPGFVQRVLSGHAAVGLLASGLLYLVCLTGALAVFQQDLQRWEEPGIPEVARVSPAAVQHALEETLARQGKPTDHAYVHMPTRGLPRLVVTTDNGANYVDNEGAFVAPEAHAWTEFVLTMHYYLHLPPTWGVMFTGLLGVMLCVALVTGVLAHPRIFRDAFRMRLRARPQLARADLHNRFGVWLLPFAGAVAFTGAVIGLGQLVFVTIAQERHGGDLETAYAPLFGEHPAHDPRPAPGARADRALAWMARHHPGHRVTYVTIEETATRGQQISVLADHDRRLIYGESYLFDGEGRFKRKLGLSDGALGQQAAASVYKLHFGTFAGIPVELAYLGFGLGLCAIISTGTTLWLMKRRSRGTPSPRLEALWAVTIWGAPLLMVAAYWLRALGGAEMPLTGGFWLAFALLGALAAAVPGLVRKLNLRLLLAAALVATGAGHYLANAQLPAASIVIDVALALGGVLLALPELRSPGIRLAKSPPAPDPRSVPG